MLIFRVCANEMPSKPFLGGWDIIELWLLILGLGLFIGMRVHVHFICPQLCTSRTDDLGLI